MAAVALGAALAALAVAAERGGAGASAGCTAPPELLSIVPALTHVAARVKQRQPLTIVAIGSSSTRGVGASAPDKSYPSRLAVELARRFPGIALRVVNRGKNGEEVVQMLARLEADVVAEHPDLVIWQLGTNAVLHQDNVALDEEPIERGLERLRAASTDVVLMDMQYAPRVLARPAYAAMKRLIADEAKRGRVGLFRRFDLMQYWRGATPAPEQMVGPDGLHMTDQGYGCLAEDLAEALATNLRRYDAAPDGRGGGGRVAGLDKPLPKVDVALPAP